MKINLKEIDNWEDFLDNDKKEIKKFPKDNQKTKYLKKEAVRQARKAKMNARAQEEKSSFLGDAD